MYVHRNMEMYNETVTLLKHQNSTIGIQRHFERNMWYRSLATKIKHFDWGRLIRDRPVSGVSKLSTFFCFEACVT